MTSVNELAQRVQFQLGENNVFYPLEDVITYGLSVAQRLLCLWQSVRVERVLVSLVPEQALIDLRQVLPRGWQVQRVVLGDVRTQDGMLPVTGRARDLLPSALGAEMHTRHWWRQTGTPRRWYLYGTHWLGIVPRPFTALDVTLIAASFPLDLSPAVLGQEPSLPLAWHDWLATLATPLLLWRESGLEAQKALTQLQALVQGEARTRKAVPVPQEATTA